MTTLNKIVQVMVIVGLAQLSTAAFAADTGISQSNSAFNKSEVAQSSSAQSDQSGTNMNSDASAGSSTQVNTQVDGRSSADSNKSADDEASVDDIDEGNMVDEDEAQSSANSLDLNNLVKVETLQTGTVETLNKALELNNNTLTQTSNKAGGQLTNTSAFTSNTALESVVLLNDNSSLSSTSMDNADNALTQNADDEATTHDTDQGELVKDEADSDLSSALDTTLIVQTTAGMTSDITTLLAQDSALSTATNVSTVVEQTIQTNVADSITSSTQDSVSESVNSQISTLVSEQINNEIATATAAEVVNTISNDLSLGL